jgi:hypothetical protein
MNSPACRPHGLVPVAVPVVLPAEADPLAVDGDQAIVGDGDAVGVAPDIVEDLRRTSEGPLGIDHPLGTARWCQVAAECCGLMQVTVLGEEVQFARGKCLLQMVEEQPPEHPRQHADRQEELGAAGDPAPAIRCDPTPRHQAMQMQIYVGRRIMPSRRRESCLRRRHRVEVTPHIFWRVRRPAASPKACPAPGIGQT